MVNSVTPKLHADYLRSGCWICEASPTHAHHWIYSEGIWTCKYCEERRRFPNTFSTARGPSQKVEYNGEYK